VMVARGRILCHLSLSNVHFGPKRPSGGKIGGLE
jgi:hypothetical protein